MKVVALLNNHLGLEALLWLKRQSDEVVGLVVHPKAHARFRDEIILASGLSPSCVFEGPQLNEAGPLRRLAELGADVAVSVMFGYILRTDFLALFPDGCVNLHPALLPYNRGAHPNVWSIIDGTPAGTTLHYVDSGVDTGDIIAQHVLAVAPEDTGQTLYGRLEAASLDLFQRTWPLLRERRAPRQAQTGEAGTLHRTRDVERVDRIDLDRKYTARELINILRARTFPPYRGAYFVDGKKRVYLSLSLEALPFDGPGEA